MKETERKFVELFSKVLQVLRELPDVNPRRQLMLVKQYGKQLDALERAAAITMMKKMLLRLPRDQRAAARRMVAEFAVRSNDERRNPYGPRT